MVSDLARILRVPGTLNHKNTPPGRVEVIEANLRRYPLSVFDKCAVDSEPFDAVQIPFEPDVRNGQVGFQVCERVDTVLMDKRAVAGLKVR